MGYADRYPAWFHGQNLDMTRVPVGSTCSSTAQLAPGVRELRYENDAASVRLRLTRTNGVPHVQVLARCPDSEWCPD